MKKAIITIAATAAMTLASASPALADPGICHDGILSDDAGQGCADGLYAQVYGIGGGSSSSGICSNGILSDDAGQGCADGLYARIFGSGGGSTSAPTTSSYSGGSGNLSGIAQCESGGNPRAVSPSGQYRGLYQFDYQTWRSVGGSGDPAAASVQEQTMRAQRLYSQRGSSPWPVCGR
jgi:hypothetical protein